MKAAVFKGVGRPLIINEVERPKPGNGEVLIEVMACGICGSDLHATEHGLIYQDGIPGHEYAGIIAEKGTNVSSEWQIGDRVYAMPTITCGECSRCRIGDTQRCQNSKTVGAIQAGDLPGAYAEYCLGGSRDLIRLPDHMPFDQAALTEPLATGLKAVRDAQLKPFENVLIVGAGPIGLSIAVWSRFFGVGHVVVSERNGTRKQLAMEIGATHVIDGSKEEDVVAAFTKRVGRAPDVIFEAVGDKGMIQRLIEIAPRCSRIMVVGVCMETDSFNPMDAIFKEITLKFVLTYNKQDCQFTIDMMAANRIIVKPLITHHIRLSELPDTFEKLRSPSNQCKVMWTP